MKNNYNKYKVFFFKSKQKTNTIILNYSHGIDLSMLSVDSNDTITKDDAYVGFAAISDESIQASDYGLFREKDVFKISRVTNENAYFVGEDGYEYCDKKEKVKKIICSDIQIGKLPLIPKFSIEFLIKDYKYNRDLMIELEVENNDLKEELITHDEYVIPVYKHSGNQ